MDRRKFLSTSAAGVTAAASFANLAVAATTKPKRVGMIGTGWYGKCDLFRLLQIAGKNDFAPVEVVSLCDVDSRMLDEAANLTAARQDSKKKPRMFGDYREMLKEKDLDIVLVETPDHWHALPMIEAVKSGADVYVQKPTGVDVIESQAMLNAARKYGRVVQVGTQRRSTPHLIDARNKIVREGKLGKIGLVEVYCYYHMRDRSNPPDTTPPDYLDYEMWTGPAPMRPYNPLVHPRKWRAFMEYSNGIVGDMCVHMFDMVRWMLDLDWPKRISSSGGIMVEKDVKANTPDTQTATFEYDDLNVVWQHRSYGRAADPEYPWGATIYGDKGTLKASVNKFEFIPMRGGETIKQEAVFEFEKYPEDRTEKDLERHVASAIRGHMTDLLHCIESRNKPVADIEQGHISSASCILANVALQVGRTLEWNPATHRVVGDNEANGLLARTYRKPWVHPDPANV